MANIGLREACADILEALTGSPVVHGNPRKVGRLLRSADTLRWCERFQYGDPVPADMVQARVDAAIAEAREEVEDEFAAALKVFAEAVAEFEEDHDGVSPLLQAWDEFRAAVAW